MKTRIDRDGTIETDYDDATIERAHTEPTPENTGNPAYSAAIMKMLKKMRRGSIAENNERSQRIAKAQKKEMEMMDRKKKKEERGAAKKTVKPNVKPMQRTFVDF